MNSRQVALVFVLGTLFGVAFAVFAGMTPFAPSQDVSVPSKSAVSGAGCVDEATADRPDTAWVGQVPTAEYQAVVVNVTRYTDGPATTPRLSLEDRGDGVFALVVTSQADDEAKECPTRVDWTATLALPADFQELRVVRDGTTLFTVDAAAQSRFRSVNVTAG